MLLRTTLRLGLAFTALALPAGAAESSGYRLALTVPLGAPDKWDYVVFDPSSARVFVAHGDRVTVVDSREGRVVGQVMGTPGGSHGTAISASTGRGFTDDGAAGQALIFDLKTLKVVKRIPAAPDADGMVVDPATGRVLVADGDSGKVTVIDPKTNAAIGEIDLGGKLEGLDAVGDGRVFVAGAEKSEIVAIDARAASILRRYAIPACVSPHGVAVNAADHRVFVTCKNSRMLVLDGDTGATVATLPIGQGSDAAAWDPKRRRAFSSNGQDGTVSVIQQVTPNDYRPLPPVTTAPSARTMAVDPDSGRLFVATANLEPATGPGQRRKPKPGSLKLMIFEAEK